MDSNYIKATLFHYFRFQKQAHYIATECGAFNSDLLIGFKKDLIEVEIKTSIADFKNDFKKPKHEFYLENKADSYMLESTYMKDASGNKILGENGCWIKTGTKISTRYARSKPNLFLFAVPEELVDRVTPILVSHYPKYGLLAIGEANFRRNDSAVRNVIRPKRLHTEELHQYVKDDIVARMSSEIANLRIKQQRQMNEA